MAQGIDLISEQRGVGETANQKAGLREWLGLALLALPTLLLGIDLTLLHLALPALAIDLRPNSIQALWIIDIYGFMIAGFLVTMGVLGDRIGRRKLLLAGALMFALASVMATYSSSATMLIIARALLGVAGATLMPSTLALISNMFKNAHQRGLAIGVWATMFALGMASGPVIGGLLLAHFWWGAAFLVALPVVACLLVLAPLLLPEYRAPVSGRIDILSIGLSLLAILPVVFAIKQFAKYGAVVSAMLPLVMGALFILLFIKRQRRLSHPFVELSLFTSRHFNIALIILLVGLIGVGGTMLLVTQYLQLVVGLSPMAAGLWMGPPALAMLVAGIVSPLLARHMLPGRIIALAMGLSAIGYVLMARLDNSPQGIVLVTVSFSLVYLGLGTIASLGTDLVVSAAPASQAGAASAMSEMVQELGLAVGVAILGSLSTLVYRGLMDTVPLELTDGMESVVQDSLAGAVSVSSEIPALVLEQARDAFTTGFNIAAGISGVMIMCLAILAAVKLRPE
ncbi:MFS transporter [Bowmanella denitrificans]|uniref:MFS transporter n=1 Tax=Bowmanella denitrificans TaxID=366582 RepID=A0ABP3HGS5_9ALTE